MAGTDVLDAGSEKVTIGITKGGKPQEPVTVTRGVDHLFDRIDLQGPVEIERLTEFNTSVQIQPYMWVGVRVHAVIRIRCGADQEIYAGEEIQTRATSDALEAINVAAQMWSEEAHRIRAVLERRLGGGG